MSFANRVWNSNPSDGKRRRQNYNLSLQASSIARSGACDNNFNFDRNGYNALQKCGAQSHHFNIEDGEIMYNKKKKKHRKQNSTSIKLYRLCRISIQG